MAYITGLSIIDFAAVVLFFVACIVVFFAAALVMLDMIFKEHDADGIKGDELLL